MTQRTAYVLGLACGIALTAEGAALAARVEARQACETVGRGECYFVPEATYTAAAGEANDVSVTYVDGRFVFRDVVPVEAGPGCESRSPVEAACVSTRAVVRLGDGGDAASSGPLPPTGYPSPPRLTIHAGDGADRLVTPNADVTAGEGADEVDGRTVDGGPGDDRLTGGHVDGGPGRDLVIGTDTANTLTGGPDQDELRGGGGNDRLVGDGGDAYDTTRRVQPATDVLDGGDGTDAADYPGHLPSVTVDVARGVGGADGEGDLLRAVESAGGGSGDDLLLGDDGPNRLDGGAGNDRVHGGGGDDALYGDSSDDVLEGGPGDDFAYGGYGVDTLEGREGNDRLSGGADFDRVAGGDGDDVAVGAEGGSDLIECGAGMDIVETPEKSRFQRDCERIHFHFFMPPFAPFPSERADGRLVFKFSCPKPRACRGQLRMRLPGGPPDSFVKHSWSARTGRPRVVVALPRAVRERTADPLRVVIELTGQQRDKDSFNRQLNFGGRWAVDLR